MIKRLISEYRQEMEENLITLNVLSQDDIVQLLEHELTGIQEHTQKILQNLKKKE